MKKVLVLYGGMSSERTVSLTGGKAVAEALQQAGYRVYLYDLTEDIGDFMTMLEREKPDVVFNALHGRYGEDGCIQGLLNLARIPYTHSGVLAASVGMNKAMTRRLAQSIGIPVPEGALMTKVAFEANEPPMPYVIKPNAEGSSVGVHIVRTAADRGVALDAWPSDQSRLVETYIAGKELSVAVLNGQALGIVEIVPETGYYDYHNKYTEGGARHLIPAPLPPADYEHLMAMAEQMHRLLGCRGTTRCDFRYDDVTDPAHPQAYLLEINITPGMTPLSLVPDIALRCRQMSYTELVVKLVEAAACDI